jgi:sulfoxide reductase heme-binding subunit YedZ
MIEFIANLPIWQMIRYLGIASYILLAIGICLGISYSLPRWNGKSKAKLHKWHTGSTIAGTGLGLLHGFITVIDQYTPFNWTEVLIPFTAVQAPFLNGIGTLSGYGMLIVILSSDLRNKIKRKAWIMIHLLSYPIFIMAFIHGYFLGTDTGIAGIRWIYFLTIASVVVLTAIRFVIVPSPRKKLTPLS